MHDKSEKQGNALEVLLGQRWTAKYL